MPIEKLITYFNSYVKLNSRETEAVKEVAAMRKYKRKQYILQQGDVCHHYSFVVSGCVKMYSTDGNGKEHNLQFAIENKWIADISSLHSKKPSDFCIETIEPTVIFQIALTDLVFLYRTHPKFNLIFRVITENAFVEFQDRVLQNISTTADERYRRFLAQYPELSNRLPNTQIASYLGITPEFLSTIRKKIVS